MSSRIRTLANAVVQSLNAATFALPFEAEFIYSPSFELKQLKDLRVTVTSRTTEHEVESRGSTLRMITIDIVVQRMVGFDVQSGRVNHDEVDELVQLTEAIADHLDLLNMAGEYHWLGSQLGPNLLPVKLREQHVYTGLVMASYQHTVKKA